MKSLLLIQAYLGRPDYEELVRLEQSDAYPRVTLFERSLHADPLNENALVGHGAWKTWCYHHIPISLAQVLEAWKRRKQYDVVISWAELLGIPFAALMWLRGDHTPHIGIFSWISKPKKAFPLKFLASRFDRIILMSSVQRSYAVYVLGLPPEKVVLLRWSVDQLFWRPLPCETDMICSVGREMRDYVTFIHALNGLSIPCHLATGGLTGGKNDPWMKGLKELGALPSTISVGKKNYGELRDLYARSRFVVIPLFQTETDNGTTSILEAMAMGKAVICTKTNGQADVIQDGVNGMFVPVGDVHALREAIQYLWTHPDVAERMGQAGRALIEQYHTVDIFVDAVQTIVEEVIEERRHR